MSHLGAPQWRILIGCVALLDAPKSVLSLGWISPAPSASPQGTSTTRRSSLQLPHFSRSLLCWSKADTVSSCALRSTMCRGTIPSPVLLMQPGLCWLPLPQTCHVQLWPVPPQGPSFSRLSHGRDPAPQGTSWPCTCDFMVFHQPMPAGPTGLATRCAELHVADCYCEEAYGNIIVNINVPWLTLHINFKGKTLWINIRSSYYAVKSFAIIVLLQGALRDSEDSCV